MRRPISALAVIAPVVWAAGVRAEPPPVQSGAQPRTGPEAIFVGCPVYRDTDAGPKSGCWLATDPVSGVRYDVSHALTKPMLGREILVEGRGVGSSAACGDTLLKPVHVSVLDTPCPKHLLPAEGLPGNRFAPPGAVMQPLYVPRPKPEPPFELRHFSIWFDFDSDFLRYQYSEVILEKAALYAAASDARVTVTGFADTAGFTASGRQLDESPALARRRAERVAEALRRLGVASGRVQALWQDGPDPLPEGDLAQPSLRRVEILLEP